MGPFLWPKLEKGNAVYFGADAAQFSSYRQTLRVMRRAIWQAATLVRRSSPRTLAFKGACTLFNDEMDGLFLSQRQKKLCKALAASESNIKSFTIKGPEEAQFNKNFALHLIIKVKFPLVAAAANKLLSVHVTTAAAEQN